MRFLLPGGQTGDVIAAPDLPDGFTADSVIAGKVYGSNALRELIAEAGAEAVIPSNRTRRVRVPLDAVRYRERNRIERFFNKLKHFRRVATRYDRRACHFLAGVYLANTVIWLR